MIGWGSTTPHDRSRGLEMDAEFVGGPEDGLTFRVPTDEDAGPPRAVEVPDDSRVTGTYRWLETVDRHRGRPKARYVWHEARE